MVPEPCASNAERHARPSLPEPVEPVEMKNLITTTLIAASCMTSASLALAQQQDAPSKPAKQQALPLDHGPHAQVTPWVNQQKRQHAAAAEKAKPAPQDKS